MYKGLNPSFLSESAINYFFRSRISSFFYASCVIHSFCYSATLDLVDDPSQCIIPTTSTRCGESQSCFLGANSSKTGAYKFGRSYSFFLSGDAQTWLSPVKTLSTRTAGTPTVFSWSVDSSNFLYSSTSDDVRLAYITTARPSIKSFSLAVDKQNDQEISKRYFYLDFNGPYFVFKVKSGVSNIRDLLNSSSWDDSGASYALLTAESAFGELSYVDGRGWVTTYPTKTMSDWAADGGYLDDGKTTLYIGWSFGSICYQLAWPPLPYIEKALLVGNPAVFGYLKSDSQYHTRKKGQNGTSAFVTDLAGDNFNALENTLVAILSDLSRSTLKASLQRIAKDSITNKGGSVDKVVVHVKQEQGVVTAGTDLSNAYSSAVSSSGFTVADDASLTRFLSGISSYMLSNGNTLSKVNSGSLLLTSDAVLAANDRLSKTSLTDLQKKIILNAFGSELSYLEMARRICQSFKDTSPVSGVSENPRGALLQVLNDSSKSQDIQTTIKDSASSISKNDSVINTALLSAISKHIFNDSRGSERFLEPKKYIMDAVLYQFLKEIGKADSIAFDSNGKSTVNINFNTLLLDFINYYVANDNQTETGSSDTVYQNIRKQIAKFIKNEEGTIPSKIGAISPQLIGDSLNSCLTNVDISDLFQDELSTSVDGEVSSAYVKMITEHLVASQDSLKDAVKSFVNVHFVPQLLASVDSMEDAIKLLIITSDQADGGGCRTALLNFIPSDIGNFVDSDFTLLKQYFSKRMNPALDTSHLSNTYFDDAFLKMMLDLLGDTTSTKLNEAVTKILKGGDTQLLDGKLSTLIDMKSYYLYSAIMDLIESTIIAELDTTATTYQSAIEAISRDVFANATDSSNAYSGITQSQFEGLIANKVKTLYQSQLKVSLVSLMKSYLSNFAKDSVILSLAGYFADNPSQDQLKGLETAIDALPLNATAIRSLNSQLDLTDNRDVTTIKKTMTDAIIGSLGKTSNLGSIDQDIRDSISDIVLDFDIMTAPSLDFKPPTGTSVSPSSVIYDAVSMGIIIAKKILLGFDSFNLVDGTQKTLKGYVKTVSNSSISIQTIMNTIKADINFSGVNKEQKNLMLRCILFELSKISCLQTIAEFMKYDAVNDPIASELGAVISQDSSGYVTDTLGKNFEQNVLGISSTFSSRVIDALKEELDPLHVQDKSLKMMIDELYEKLKLSNA